MANSGGPARRLINGVGSRNHWLGLRLLGMDKRRDMVEARADGSYASANDPRVLVGLCTSADALRVRVIWPSGRTEEWSNVPVDRYTDADGGSQPLTPLASFFLRDTQCALIIDWWRLHGVLTTRGATLYNVPREMVK